MSGITNENVISASAKKEAFQDICRHLQQKYVALYSWLHNTPIMHVVVFVGHIFISLFYISTICQKDVWSFSLHIISLYSRSSLSFTRFLHFHVIYIWDHSIYQYHYCCLALHILLSCSTATNVTPLTMKALPDMRLKPRKNTVSPSLMINI